MKVLIVGGAGNFGRFYAKWFSQKGWEVSIISDDHDEGERVARVLGVGYVSNPTEAKNFDVVAFSVPPRDAPRIIEEYLPSMDSGSLLVDFSSIKSHVAESASKFDGEVLLLHPMHGPDVPSLKNIAVLAVPLRRGEKYSAIRNLFLQEGALWREVSAEQHDRLMAHVQAFTHFFSAVGMKFLLDSDLPSLRKAASTNFELLYQVLARISSRAPSLYAELQELNPFAKEVRQKVSKLMADAVENPRPYFEEVSSNIPDADKVSLITGKFLKTLEEELPLSISALGPRGSFSEKAAEHVSRFIDAPTKLVFKGDIYSVLESPSDVAVVPVENSLGGSVVDALDALLLFPKPIFLEVVVPIHHSLVALPGHGPIEKVFSHPQAIAQCRNYLARNLPGVEIIKTRSTSEAMERVLEEGGNAAAIGRKDFAESLGLKVIDTNIEDVKNNATRFWALGSPPLFEVPSEKFRTTLLIDESKDRPGLLRDILNVLAERNINLSMLESRPSREALGQYRFFMDLDGKLSEEMLEEIREELRGEATVKLLGTYPVLRMGE